MMFDLLFLSMHMKMLSADALAEQMDTLKAQHLASELGAGGEKERPGARKWECFWIRGPMKACSLEISEDWHA